MGAASFGVIARWLTFGIATAVLSGLAFLSVSLPVSTTASAQFFPFFDDRYPFIERRRPPREYYQPRERPAPPVDHTRAPPPSRKADNAAKSVIVFGDSMADWLGYGLEEAFSETPEIGIVRKPRTVSGLVRNEARSDSVDWVQSAKEILAAEKADFVVVMLGMHDRQAIRERVVRTPPPQPTPSPAAPPGGSQQGKQQAEQLRTPAPFASTQVPQPAPTPDLEKPPENLLETEKAAPEPSIIAPEPAPAPASSTSVHEFRSERWEELYAKRVDDMVAALKAKGVPVYWVGLPAIRGTRSTSDMAYLNDFVRARVERGGAMYIDVWDGFVDDNGNFASQGPDLEGQIRRLRTADGVHFTKAGARKLAHFVEREIQRALVARPVLVSLPASDEPLLPAAKPGQPTGRPAAGPIVYLTGNSTGAQELLGGGAVRNSAPDAVAAKVLVKGEPVAAPPGRADDFAWPRREISMASVSNITEPAVPEPPGSRSAAAAAVAAVGAAAPAVVKPVPQKRVARRPAAPPPEDYAPRRSFWPFGGGFFR